MLKQFLYDKHLLAKEIINKIVCMRDDLAEEYGYSDMDKVEYLDPLEEYVFDTEEIKVLKYQLLDIQEEISKYLTSYDPCHSVCPHCGSEQFVDPEYRENREYDEYCTSCHQMYKIEIKPIITIVSKK